MISHRLLAVSILLIAASCAAEPAMEADRSPAASVSESAARQCVRDAECPLDQVCECSTSDCRPAGRCVPRD